MYIKYPIPISLSFSTTFNYMQFDCRAAPRQYTDQHQTPHLTHLTGYTLNKFLVLLDKIFVVLKGQVVGSKN